ncbi:MAG: hypothetical protein DRR04_15005, partial [Gammaproteobacteria bacterium]
MRLVIAILALALTATAGTYRPDTYTLRTGSYHAGSYPHAESSLGAVVEHIGGPGGAGQIHGMAVVDDDASQALIVM